MISFEKNKVIKINFNFFWNVLDHTRDFETSKVIFAIPWAIIELQELGVSYIDYLFFTKTLN